MSFFHKIFFDFSNCFFGIFANQTQKNYKNWKENCVPPLKTQERPNVLRSLRAREDTFLT